MTKPNEKLYDLMKVRNDKGNLSNQDGFFNAHFIGFGIFYKMLFLPRIRWITFGKPYDQVGPRVSLETYFPHS